MRYDALERGDLVEVVGLDRVGVDQERLAGLVVLQLEHPLEREEGLGLVEDVEDDHVVPGVPEPVQGLAGSARARRAGR